MHQHETHTQVNSVLIRGVLLYSPLQLSVHSPLGRWWSLSRSRDLTTLAPCLHDSLSHGLRGREDERGGERERKKEGGGGGGGGR